MCSQEKASPGLTHCLVSPWSQGEFWCMDIVGREISAWNPKELSSDSQLAWSKSEQNVFPGAAVSRLQPGRHAGDSDICLGHRPGCCSVTKSCLTLWSHGLQHARLPWLPFPLRPGQSSKYLRTLRFCGLQNRILILQFLTPKRLLLWVTVSEWKDPSSSVSDKPHFQDWLCVGD